MKFPYSFLCFVATLCAFSSLATATKTTECSKTITIQVEDRIQECECTNVCGSHNSAFSSCLRNSQDSFCGCLRAACTCEDQGTIIPFPRHLFKRADIRCPRDQVRAEFMNPIARDTVFNAIFGNSKGMYSIEDVSAQRASASEYVKFQVESTDKTAINLKKLKKRWQFDDDSRLFRFDLQSIFDPAQGKITVQWIVFEKLAPEDFPEVSQTAYNDELFGKLFNKKYFERDGKSYRVRKSVDGRAVTKNDYVIPSAVDLIASQIEYAEEVRSDFKLSELKSIAMKNVMEPRTEKVLMEILRSSEDTHLPLTITFEDDPEEYEKLMKTPLSALTTRTFKYLTTNKKIPGGFDNKDYTLIIDQDVQDGIGGGYTIVYTINRQ